MNNYKINCSNCSFNISMLTPIRPLKCPSCDEYFRYNDVDDGKPNHQGLNINNNYSSGSGTYIHAEGECLVKSENDIVINTPNIVTAIKGARVEMNAPTIDKKVKLPYKMNYNGIEISAQKVDILQKIVRNVIGVEDTFEMSSDELKLFFNIINIRICNGLEYGLNGGALTGIRCLYGSDSFEMIEIINDYGLTDNGVELFKLVASELKLSALNI
ncbi:hypothetical protein [Photobacterium carnosum]|uniref:hypothetical protein n=1 Tax=Photobacterium carnosum TaxID=2023717 RepID=UPI001E61FA36|nr:hypothetical protein [Photobacterium carnosum]MCD9494113.1 hypothetical protein [Photobacterium carnosum]